MSVIEHRSLDPRVGDARRVADPVERQRPPLADYLDALRRARWLLIAGPILAAVVALAVSFSIAPKFSATTTLLVSGSKLGERAVTPPDVRNYRALMENQSLAEEMIAQFTLGGPPFSLTPGTFLQSVLSITEVRGSELLELSITLGDPKLAAAVANAMADRVVARSQSLFQEETGMARDMIKAQLDASRETLTAARTALESYQKTAQVELLQKELDAAIALQAGLSGKQLAIATERARLAKAEEELAKQEPVRQARGALRSTPTSAGTQDSTLDLRDDVRDPFVNPVYENLQQEVTSTRTKLAAFERERDELLRARDRQGQLPRLVELYQRQARVAELSMQQQLAEKVYVETATKYEQTRAQVAGRSAQLQVIDRALPPDRRVSPVTTRNVSAAFVLALSVLTMGVVIARAVRRVTAAASS